MHRLIEFGVVQSEATAGNNRAKAFRRVLFDFKFGSSKRTVDACVKSDGIKRKRAQCVAYGKRERVIWEANECWGAAFNSPSTNNLQDKLDRLQGQLATQVPREGCTYY